MAWFYLVVAGLFEVVWAIGLKYSHGFTRVVPSIITVAALIASMVMLATAARSLPIGTAYGVWVGIGAVGAAIGGIVLFREPVTGLRVAFLVLLVAAIVGLRLTSTSGAENTSSGDRRPPRPPA